MTLRGYYSSWCLLDDYTGSPPNSYRFGEELSPFPTVDLWHHLVSAQSMVHAQIQTTFNARETHS
jgi:hypothetical protein